MKKNIGKADMIGRIIVGVVLVGLFFNLEGDIRYVALVGGVVMFATALLNFCPLYLPFGISTKKN